MCYCGRLKFEQKKRESGERRERGGMRMSCIL